MSTEYQAKESLTFDEAIEKLNSLVGLAETKKELAEYFMVLQALTEREALGLPIPNCFSYHLILKGNIGTGKSTVVHLMGQLYKSLGILERGHVITVDRSDLVAGYIGQTAMKTHEVVQKALGGILYIENAPNLVDRGGRGFGSEAVDMLYKCIKEYYGKFIVILSGNSSDFDEFNDHYHFLTLHFPKEFAFEDYNADELIGILKAMCQKTKLELEPNAEAMLYEHFESIYNARGKYFSNAYVVQNVFQRILGKQALRLQKAKADAPEQLTEKMLSSVTAEDVAGAIQ